MRALALVILMCAGAAAAAPDRSERPVARGDFAGLSAPVLVRPVARKVADPVAEIMAAVMGHEAVWRPALRPRAIEQKAMARQNARRKGQVCGDPDLQGDVVGAVPGRIKGCGVSEAVRLRSVSGVTLSQPALIDCNTARALKTWTEKSAKKVLRGVGGGLAGYQVAAHYACRTRNNQKGARISEHGRGRAIDISGFVLKDGSRLTVLNDWNSKHGKSMKALHKGACGPFGTVLGPRSDRFHRDHFHFDTARYRSGAYCR